MRRSLALILALALLTAARPARAENAPRSLKTVFESAHRKDKVLIAGKIIRARALDLFILSDGSAEALVNASYIQMPIAPGDSLVIWGRFMGRSDRMPEFQEIEVIEAAKADTPEAAKLLAAHASAAPTPSPFASSVPSPMPMPTTAPAPRSTESRLRELDDLKAKKMVTEPEYREQRKRIIEGL